MTAEQQAAALVDGGIATDMDDAYMMLVDAGEISESDEAIPVCAICGEHAYEGRPLITRNVIGYGRMHEAQGHRNCLNEYDMLDC